MSSEAILNQRIEELGRYLLIMRKAQDASTAAFVASLGGLSLQELNVINIVGDNEPCIMSEIAKQAALSLSSVTVIVDKLVKANLVQRIRSEEDRRIVSASLTEEGKQVYFVQIKHIHEIIHRILSSLASDEQETFLKLFQKITQAMV
jgi:DNA-binding MarR family transcriptional regulator